MYLDTLKVSTLEQTAEETSARGGKGNPELITWDYGKAISLSLEDALFTPASQSLMWGGKFGIKKPKVQGLWNPLVYPKDEYGRIQYLEKTVYDITESDPQTDPRTATINDLDIQIVYDDTTGKWNISDEETDENKEIFITLVQFICPCDTKTKFAHFSPVKADYKYESLDDYAVGYKCPKGYDTGEREKEEDTEALLVKTYYWNIGEDSIAAGLARKQRLYPDIYKGRPERAEIAIDNYGDFNFTTFDMRVLTGTLSGDIITIDENDENQFCIYTPIPRCDSIIGDSSTACGSFVAAYGYEWNKVDMKMTSLEGDQDIYYLENANLRYRVPRNSTQKEIMIGREGFYETEYDADSEPQWIKVQDAEEITNIMELTRQNTERQSYGYFVNPYDATVDFFMNIELTLPIQNNETIKRFVRVPLGRFYIIADWNFGGDTAYDLMYPIVSGMENVNVLERMEKCKATQTFAIDTNKNLAMSNYRYTQEYSDAPLTVFIDPRTMKPYEPNAGTFVRQNGDVITGNLHIIKQYEIYYKWTRTVAPSYTTLGHRIIVDAEHFPGTYRIVGETYCRSRDDGKDQRYQFEIPLAKLSAETNLTLQADGDPTTFSMKFKVMRRDDGVMMKLTQYDINCETYNGYTSGSTKVIPSDTIEDNTYDTIYTYIKEADVRLINPGTSTRAFVENLDGQTNITENIGAVLHTVTNSSVEEYNTQTLEVISSQQDIVENTEPLNDNDYIVTVENLDEEVGE